MPLRECHVGLASPAYRQRLPNVETNDMRGDGPQESGILDGSRLRILIVHALWNKEIVDALVKGAYSRLREHGVTETHIDVQSVPGSFELPFAVSAGASRQHIENTLYHSPETHLMYDAIIAVGVLVKGESMHFEYISETVSHALMRIGIESKVPVIFGVLTVLSEEQARARAGLTPDGHNHGVDWADAAVTMALKYGPSARRAVLPEPIQE